MYYLMILNQLQEICYRDIFRFVIINLERVLNILLITFQEQNVKVC